MQLPAQVEPVLACYGADCQPSKIEAVGPGGGFSGALIWRLTAARGRLALRRWPREHPDPAQLQFIHAVLGHVARHGFTLVPTPIPTEQGAAFVESAGHLWELAPWLPGEADYLPERRPEKLAAALEALAQFHLAAASFPLQEALPAPSPGISQRLEQVEMLRGGGLQRILAAATDAATGREKELTAWGELSLLAPRCAALFVAVAPAVSQLLAAARGLVLPLQPCLRDVWSEHVLFEGSRVSGLIDFGAMRVESVAADVARLLGSMAADDPAAWRLGLAAYQTVRPLSADEFSLVTGFDQSTTLLAAWNWFQWVFVDRRMFADPSAVTVRVKQIIARLEVLAGHGIRLG